jgi:hypothetical protein
MKKIYLSLFIIVSRLISFSQPVFTDTITFEKKGRLVRIDNSQPNNIWQIGKPQKIFFDSAYSKPKAIVTDTINPYPINNLSSFQLVMKQQWFGSGGVPYLQFRHKFDTDSLRDGGYIETSYDGGATWINAANNSDIYGMGIHDTILGGIHAFTGKSSNGWYDSQIGWFGWCWGLGQPPAIIPDSIIVRFTFKSDNIQTNKEGWMIDNIMVGLYWCPIDVHEIYSYNNFNVFPNPFSTSAIIKINDSNLNLKNERMKVYNVLTEEVFPIITPNSEGFIIRRGNLTSGVYFYKVYSENNILGTGKLMIE